MLLPPVDLEKMRGTKDSLTADAHKVYPPLGQHFVLGGLGPMAAVQTIFIEVERTEAVGIHF